MQTQSIVEYFEGHDEDEFDEFDLEEFTEMVRAWEFLHPYYFNSASDEEIIQTALNKYFGRFENQSDFIKHYLSHLEPQLENLEFTINGTKYYLNFDCLDEEYLWNYIFKYQFTAGFFDMAVESTTPVYFYVFADFC